MKALELSTPEFRRSLGPAPAGRRFWILVLLLTVAATIGLGGCRSTSEELEETIPPPIQLRRSFPGLPDSTGVTLADLEWPSTVRLEFNRFVQLGDVEVSFYPPPLSEGGRRVSTTSKFYFIDDFDPDRTGPIQRLLVDGPGFLKPYILRFYTDPPGILRAEAIAAVFTRGEGVPDPQHALLLAYTGGDVSAVNSLQQLLLRAPADIALASESSAEDLEWIGRFTNLIADELYTMVAITDSSGDGIYDPAVDWWGAATAGVGATWVADFVTAQSLFEAEQLRFELTAPN